MAKKYPQRNATQPARKGKKAETPFSGPVMWLTVVVVLALAVTAVVFLIRRPPAEPASAYPDEITVAEAAQEYESGAFVLDVRTPQEWEEFHVPGSTHIPLDELSSRLSEVPKDQEVVVVCRSGNRSAQARDLLRNAGFEQVTSLAGGLTQWRAEGFPTVSGP